MFEYLVVESNVLQASELEAYLNSLAHDGWRIICAVETKLVLEREKQPEIIQGEDGSVTFRFT